GEYCRRSSRKMTGPMNVDSYTVRCEETDIYSYYKLVNLSVKKESFTQYIHGLLSICLAEWSYAGEQIKYSILAQNGQTYLFTKGLDVFSRLGNIILLKNSS